ncbi:MAG: MFS transporter [Thermomicrobiales bacterium]
MTIRNFRFLWFGMLFSMSAMQINIVARSWLAYDITGSAFMLGVVAAARSLPQLMLAPVGGVAADRFDKRRLLITSQALLTILALINAILVHAGVIEIWHLFVIGVVQGVLHPFTMPTRTALVPHLVSDRQIPNALALDSTGRNINRITAPALAGILIAINPTLAFYAIFVAYALATLTLAGLPSGLRGAALTGSALTEIAVGFKYIRAHAALLALMLMSFVVVILGMPFQQLLPVFQKDVLDVGPRALGFMFTAVGVGAIVGSLLVAFLADRPDMGRMQLGAGLLFGVGLTGFALSKSFVLSLGLLVIVGFASQGYLTINRMLVMQNTERHLYGRVMSIYMMTWSLVPAVVLPIGLIVDRVGVSATVAASGAALTVVLIGAAITFPRIYLAPPASAPARS